AVDTHRRPHQGEQKAARRAAGGREDPCQALGLRACRGAREERRVDDKLRRQVHANRCSQARVRSEGGPRRGARPLLVRRRRAEWLGLVPLLWVPGLQRRQACSGGERPQIRLPLLDTTNYRPPKQLEKGVRLAYEEGLSGRQGWLVPTSSVEKAISLGLLLLARASRLQRELVRNAFICMRRCEAFSEERLRAGQEADVAEGREVRLTQAPTTCARDASWPVQYTGGRQLTVRGDISRCRLLRTLWIP
ncbi:unnamed protein product, partial [Ectocarpus sp. 6 AP-2014]